MKRKKQDKVARLRKERSMSTTPDHYSRAKEIPGRTHKSHFPKMATPKEFRMPEAICAESGHREYVLAQTATKQIISCARLCGHYKVFKSRYKNSG